MTLTVIRKSRDVTVRNIQCYKFLEAQGRAQRSASKLIPRHTILLRQAVPTMRRCPSAVQQRCVIWINDKPGN